MDRLQKKCFIVSTGLHALPLLLLLVGPAFLSKAPEKIDDMPILDFIPLKTTDLNMSGGGNPNATSSPPPAQSTKPDPLPPAPAPKPEVQKTKPPEPEPVKKTPTRKPTEPDPDSLEPAPEPKVRRPVVNTKLVTRKPAEDTKAKAREAEEREEQRRQERATAERRNALASTFSRAAESLGNSLSSGTSIELKGPGGGGVPYANWWQAVKSRYMQALVEPEGITDENITAVASVTIQRDGTVSYHRITKPSGNPIFDRAVRATLDRVPKAAPLPDEFKENERTIELKFKPTIRELRG